MLVGLTFRDSSYEAVRAVDHKAVDAVGDGPLRYPFAKGFERDDCDVLEAYMVVAKVRFREVGGDIAGK